MSKPTRYPMIVIGSLMDIGALEVSANFGAAVDRRGTIRFPVREEVKYRILNSKPAAQSGTGHTLNIGSGGILLTTEDRLPVGKQVELSVNWPARLDGTCALKFVAVGRVVRSDATRAAVKIDRYEFRTRGAAAAAVPNYKA